MVEPLSISVLAGTALTEGIKFLHGQADGILKCRAVNKRAAPRDDQTPLEQLKVRTPDVVEGRLLPVRVDPAAA